MQSVHCSTATKAPTAMKVTHATVKPRSASMATFHGMKCVGHAAKKGVSHIVNATASTTRAAGRRSTAVIECKKVAVLGAAGGIGQPLSLLMKMNRMVTDLALYDIANVAGVAADLSHCNTPVQVGFSP